MAYPNNPYPAHYKYYNGNQWVEYYFRTSADLVGETGPYNGDQSYARKFVTNKVYVNGVAFAFSSLPTSGAVAEVTITGSNIVGNASVSSGSLTYITANDTVSDALGKLDKATKAAYDRTPDVSSLVPYTGATGDVYLGTHDLYTDMLYANGIEIDNGLEHNFIYNIGGDGDDHKVFHFTISAGNNYETFSLEGTNDWSGGIIATQAWVTSQIGNLGTAASKNYTTSVTNGSSDLVTSGAVYSAIAALPTPMQFKGTVGTGGTKTWSNLPSAAQSNGHAYKVITAHDTAPVCAIGDMIISNGSIWVVIPSGDEPSGTVTNVATGDGLTGGPISSTGTISLATAYGDTVNPYGSKTAHYVLAAPANAAGTPSFRALVAGDIPDLSATYLPLTAGSGKALTGDLYLGGHNINGVSIVDADSYRFTSGREHDWNLSMSGDGWDNPVIEFGIENGSDYYKFILDATDGDDGTIATKNWVGSRLTEHNIQISNSAYVAKFTFVSSSSTAITTAAALATALNSAGFNSSANSIQASGFYGTTGLSALILGVYASSSSNINIFYQTLVSTNGTTTTIQVAPSTSTLQSNPTTVTDKTRSL